MLLEKAGLGGLGRAADTSGDNVDSFLRGEHGHHTVESYISFQSDIRWVDTSASKRSIRRFVITEKAPTRAFSWLKALLLG